MSRSIHEDLAKLQAFYLQTVNNFSNLVGLGKISWNIFRAIGRESIIVQCVLTVHFPQQFWILRKELLNALGKEWDAIGVNVQFPSNWSDHVFRSDMDGYGDYRKKEGEYFSGHFQYFRYYRVGADDLPPDLSAKRKALMGRREMIRDIEKAIMAIKELNVNVIANDPKSARKKARQLIALSHYAEPKEAFNRDAQFLIREILTFFQLPLDLSVWEWD